MTRMCCLSWHYPHHTVWNIRYWHCISTLPLILFIFLFFILKYKVFLLVFFKFPIAGDDRSMYFWLLFPIEIMILIVFVDLIDILYNNSTPLSRGLFLLRSLTDFYSGYGFYICVIAQALPGGMSSRQRSSYPAIAEFKYSWLTVSLKLVSYATE